MEVPFVIDKRAWTDRQVVKTHVEWNKTNPKKADSGEVSGRVLLRNVEAEW